VNFFFTVYITVSQPVQHGLDNEVEIILKEVAVSQFEVLRTICLKGVLRMFNDVVISSACVT
jgi:hypothetical protein